MRLCRSNSAESLRLSVAVNVVLRLRLCGGKAALVHRESTGNY